MLILDSVSSGVWKPVSVSQGGLAISHLLFVDDNLLFAKASVSQMQNITEVLHHFEEVSSLHVSVEKSKVFVSKGILEETTGQVGQLFEHQTNVRHGQVSWLPVNSRQNEEAGFCFLGGKGLEQNQFLEREVVEQGRKDDSCQIGSYFNASL